MALWAPRQGFSGGQTQVLLDGQWWRRGVVGVREPKRRMLSWAVPAPCPKRDPQEQIGSERAASARCWEERFLEILGSSYSI